MNTATNTTRARIEYTMDRKSGPVRLAKECNAHDVARVTAKLEDKGAYLVRVAFEAQP